MRAPNASFHIPDGLRRPRALALLLVGFVAGFGATLLAEEPVPPATLAAASGPPLERPPELDPVPAEPLPLAEAAEGTEPPAGPAASEPDPPAELQVVTRGTLRRGQTLAQAMRDSGVPRPVIHEVVQAMRPHFDFRRAQPGNRFRLAQDADGRVAEFRFRVSEELSYRVVAGEDGWEGGPQYAELRPRVDAVSGVIRSSLYAALRSRGADPRLANDFAHIFAWDLDFTRNVQAGDDFRILYEALYRVDDDGNEVYVRPGRILAASYSGVAGDHTAIYFEGDGGPGSYFRPDGSSVEREFLVAPLQYSRITSNYTNARRHPILKVTRPHRGIDYAAPEGTPLWAVADGTVIYRGWGGDFGNLVKIRHRNGFISYYSHLQRFAKGLAVGQQVRQKEIIGYVGHTGLATGPHTCFRVARNGRFVDPRSLASPAASPVPDEQWLSFRESRDARLADLLSGGVEEAL